MEAMPSNDRALNDRGNVLIVEDDITASAVLEEQLVTMGFQVSVSRSGSQAIELLAEVDADLIFVKVQLEDMCSCELVRQINNNSVEIHTPVILLVSEPADQVLLDCLAAGGDDFLFYTFTPVVLEACIQNMEQLRELNNSYKSSVHEQMVGKQILSAALSARTIDVDGMQILSRSAAIFSGDLVLTARKPNGELHVLLADFTGHGLSAAIGVLPIAEMFSVMTEKGFEPDKILKNINKKLYRLLPTGMFMAACMLEIDSRKRLASVWNSGMPDIYLLDHSTGIIKRRIKSTRIPLGISEDIDERLKYEVFSIKPEDQFIMHSDGLTDAVDSHGKMFGTNQLMQIMEESKPGYNVFHEIISAFDKFSADDELSDDITLVAIPCNGNMTQAESGHVESDIHVDSDNKGNWRLLMELSGRSLLNIDPVQVITDQYRRLDEMVVGIDKLEDILFVLYENALNHGVLELSQPATSKDKINVIDIVKKNNQYYKLDNSFVRIELEHIDSQGACSLLLRLEDSGKGFDYVSFMSDIDNDSSRNEVNNKSGIPFVRDLSQSMRYSGKGNQVEVVIFDQLQRRIES